MSKAKSKRKSAGIRSFEIILDENRQADLVASFSQTADPSICVSLICTLKSVS